MKTQFNYIGDTWLSVKNHCRTTVGKVFTEKEPTEIFKWRLLISEHTPIRLLEFDWSWRSIPYWVSTELSRHKFEKFITTQRDDRTDSKIPRAELPQGALVNYDGFANMQNLIDAFRKRLCFQATHEARELVEDFKETLHNNHPIEANILVSNCIYRGGCPEINHCGFWEAFIAKHKDDNLLDLDTRYKLYNEDFYKGGKI